MSETESFVRVEKLAKHFGATRVFDDLSFGIDRGEFITLLGPSGCGKTTLLHAMAAHGARKGWRVLASTTTHIQRPKEPLLARTNAELAALWTSGNYAVAGAPAPDNKLTQPPQLERWMAQADAVFLEADGAKHLPCKAPAAHEPVLLPQSDIVLAVAGLSAVGKPLQEVCFRLETACTAFTIVFAVPFILGLGLSFTEFTTVLDAKWVAFENYIKAFSNRDFLNALWFTVKFAVVSVITINVISFALASLLTKGLSGTNIFRTVFFMPNLIGGIVLGYIWQLIINGILQNIGVTITYDAKYGFWGLVVMMNWQLIGYMMIIYIAGIQNIPSDLQDASKVDGASRWQTLRHVTIPLVMPSVTICLFLTITNSFKLFDQNLALTAGAPSKQTAMLALDIYNTFYGKIGWEGVGQAKAVIFFIIVAAISFAQLILTRKKEVEQ